jgi:hypothetical protein
MSPLDMFWAGVMSLLTPLVTPDWGRLVDLIPLLILGLVVLYLAWVIRAWVRIYRAQPVRGPKVRKPDYRPMIVGHVIVVGIGVVTVVTAFIAGSRAPGWTGANSPLGLVVNLPLLLLGLGLIIGAAGNAARRWERHGRDDVEPDLLDAIDARIRRHPHGTRRLVVFISGVMIAVTGMLLGTPPGPIPAYPVPVAFLPVLLPGLVMAVGAVGASIVALWSEDHDLDLQTPKGEDSAVAVLRGH